MSIPIVDWRELSTNRASFLADVEHAMADIGFMCLTNVPGFEPEVQAHTMAQVHAFFDSSNEVKQSASIAHTPYMRGYDPIVQTMSALIETYQFGPDLEPAVADHTDQSEPIWKRMFHGPQTWPNEQALPEFRGTINNLTQSYLDLHHMLGELICEILGAPQEAYGELFDREHPIPLAFVGRSYSLSHVHRGGLATNRRGVKSGDEGVRQMQENIAKGAGAHVDITPMMALLTMDAPGLQVLAKGGEWVDMPVIPGAVCVNAGSTLQHLSSGRMIATMHRVNSCQIPDNTTRVSCPFFLMPRFDAKLTPFRTPFGEAGSDDTSTDGTNYPDQDRGVAAAFNRMSLFRPCTRKFWAAEFEAAKAEQRQLAAEENASVAKQIRGATRAAL
jgi:isopenicillin N synthase-like dioxygenase